MTKAFSGWAVYLKSRYGAVSFLGVRKTAEGARYGEMCDQPMHRHVIYNLFDAPESALAFWKDCRWEYLVGKDSLAALPVKISLSIDVACPDRELDRINV